MFGEYGYMQEGQLGKPYNFKLLNDDEVGAPSALRIPRIGGEVLGAFGDGLIENTATAIIERRRAQRRVRPLVHQRRASDPPAVTRCADEVGHRNASIGEEDLVERRVPIHLQDGAHLDPRLLHREHEVADSFVLGHVPIGSGQQHCVVSVMRTCVPNLLPVQNPVIAIENCCCA